MSDLSPECAPKRTSADHREFLGSRPGALGNIFLRVICPTGGERKFLSSRRGKNISVLQKFDSCYGLRVPPRLKRGDRERHERGVRDAVDANALTDERRNLRTAKPCGPDAPTLASSFVQAPKACARRRWQSSIGS